MREIKFRAWNIKKKRMVQVVTFLHLDWERPEIVTRGRLVTKRHENGDSGIYLDSPNIEKAFELMQYTGLKDKNGKEIYEGDIVIGIGGSEDTRKTKRVIRYEDGGFAEQDVKWFIDKGFRNGKYGITSLSLIFDRWDGNKLLENFSEVIGNIYENKELLK